MINKILNPVITGLITASSLYAAEVTIFEEDFEGAGDALVSGGAVTTTTLVADPQAGGTRGTVMELSLDGTAQWAGLNTVPLRIGLLPLGIAPGTDTYEFTADVYVPSTTTLAVDDTTGLRIRWTDADETGKTEPAFQKRLDDPIFIRDQWVTLTLSGNIPATFGTAGGATTHIRPIYSVQDVGVNAVSGTAIYLDNVKIIATTAGEDPNLFGSNTSKFGIVAPGTTETRTYSLSNTGVSNDLVISEGALSGPGSANFTVNTTFPLTIAPGGSADIEVVFDSSTGVGAYAAALDLTTNDATDPTYSLSLSSIIFEHDPTSEELIINGDFEAGSTVGFGSGQKFEILTAPTDPVHAGNFAASYTLPGGNQWGSFELNQPSPPAVEGMANRVIITPEMIGRPYKFSCWYYRPATDGIADDDLVQFIMRWNGLTPDSAPFFSYSGADLGADTWVEYIEEGIVPATWPENDPAGVPVDSAHLIFSFRDVDTNAVGTERVFIDDLSFTVDLPEVIVVVYPEITNIARDQFSGASTFSWTTAPNQTYIVEFSADLVNWVELEDELPASTEGDSTTYTDSTSDEDEVRFYRVILNNAPAPPAE
ncbi:MAG: Ig-like domain-containing protein [Verrucomicrobiaceae bacterium]